MLVVAFKPKSELTMQEVKSELENNKIQYINFPHMKRILKIDISSVAQLPEVLRRNMSSVADPEQEIGIDFKEQSITYNANNPSSGDNWGLGRIDQTESPYGSGPEYMSVYRYTKTGKNVNVYVIDSGVNTSHSEFEGRAKTVYGSEDQNGHGTHVASTIAGKRYGVAKEANILSVQVLNAEGSASLLNVIDGMDAVIDAHQKGSTPSVANMSLGGQVRSTDNPINDAANEMIESGVILVTSAGNSGVNLDDPSVYTPAEVPRAITVGATDINDNVPEWSNYGAIVDLFAPGASITGAWLNNSVATLSGTSMATPHVAGVVSQALEGKEKYTSAINVKRLVSRLVDATTKNDIDWEDDSKYRTSPNRLLNSSFLRKGDTQPDEPDEEPVDEEPTEPKEPEDPSSPENPLMDLVNQADANLSAVGSLAAKIPHKIHAAQNDLETLRNKLDKQNKK